MGKETILKKILVSGEKSSEDIEILFDTGASRSLIKSDFCERLVQREKFFSFYPPLKFKLGDGNIVEAKFLVNLIVEISGYRLPIRFYVIDNLAKDVIFGVDNMQDWEMKIDFKTKEIILGITPDELFFYYLVEKNELLR